MQIKFAVMVYNGRLPDKFLGLFDSEVECEKFISNRPKDGPSNMFYIRKLYILNEE